MTRRPTLLLAHSGHLERDWPALLPAFAELVSADFELRVQETSSRRWDLDLSDVWALIIFDCEPDIKALEGSSVRILGGVTDGKGIYELDHLQKRAIPFVDATAGWGQSVAEFAMTLMLASLRRLPAWHQLLADGWEQWTYPFTQYCDEDDFVHGTLGGKTVGIVGLGEIGGRVAQWSAAMGATVLAYDPHVLCGRFAEVGAADVDLDTLLQSSHLVVVAVPKTATSVGLIDADRVASVAPGSIIVTVTRTIAIDVAALRSRVLRNELFWATDVYETEPLAVDDVVLQRPNVIHTPHIAGRTGDANLAVARILAGACVSYLETGDPTRHALTRERVRVRLGAASLKERERLGREDHQPSSASSG